MKNKTLSFFALTLLLSGCAFTNINLENCSVEAGGAIFINEKVHDNTEADIKANNAGGSANE